MNILAFDTSGLVLSAAIETPAGRIAEIREQGLRHGEVLASVIEYLTAQLEITIKDLDLIVCARGPGSFTGLRIGLATAKGLSAGTGVPLVSVAVPDFLYRPYSFFPGPVIPVIDGKKNRFYGAVFQNNSRVGDYFDLEAHRVLEAFPDTSAVLITGPDAPLFIEKAGTNKNLLCAPVLSSSVFNLIDEGKKVFAHSGADSPGQGPLYIRKSDAEISLEQIDGTG